MKIKLSKKGSHFVTREILNEYVGQVSDHLQLKSKVSVNSAFIIFTNFGSSIAYRCPSSILQGVLPKAPPDHSGHGGRCLLAKGMYMFCLNDNPTETCVMEHYL